MNNKIKKSWFREHLRQHLREFVQVEKDSAVLNMTDFNLYNQSEADANYKTSVLGAWITILELIRYIAVDPTGKKPWVAHKRVKRVLDLNEFKEYIGEVITRLSSQPPNANYSALVHIHTIINFLTTMEIEDGRERNTVK